MSFPKFHGITLALNAFIENLTAERLTADPAPLSAGRLWYNTTAKALKFSSLDAGGAVIVETLATGAQVQSVIDDLAALGVRVSDVEAAFINKDGSVAFTGDIDAGTHKLKNLAAGTQTGDAVNYGQLQAAVASLANAFKYIGTVNGGATTGEAYDLTGVAAQAAGSYYKVTQSGYFVLGAEGTPFYANANDGLVFNEASGVDVIDNTNSTVVGTNGFISVTGSPDTGYHVDIDATFKSRVANLESGLADEISRAQAAEAGLASDIAAETSRATTAEGVLDGKITTEKNRAEAAEAGLSTAISNEQTRAQNAEAALQSDIDAEVTRATGVEGTLSSLTTDAKTNLVAAINEVDANADAAAAAAAAEASRAQGVEGSLAALTTDVKTSLVAAINEVDAHADANASAIAAEQSRAEAAEAAIASDLSDEVARATAAEGALDTKIGPLGDLTTSNKSSVVNAINEVAAAAGAGTGALMDSINAQRYRSTSATAALSHTFTHNLNSAYVQVQVWVKGDDNIFRNDIVAVEETSANAITVSLTESRIVKVAIQALDDLA